jgi:hypothetical protein
MPKQPELTQPRTGDPPPPKMPVKADDRMRDPFTDLPTHSAAKGQGANRPKSEDAAVDEETRALEEGFSPIP